MKLRFTPRAVENIFKVSADLHERNPAAARRVRAEIFATTQNLLLFPAAGRRQHTPGVRRIVTRKYGYLI
jgi:plasmid stabilization system protein ParE